MLQRVRGTSDVDEELSSIVLANKAQHTIENPWRSIGRCSGIAPCTISAKSEMCGCGLDDGAMRNSATMQLIS